MLIIQLTSLLVSLLSYLWNSQAVALVPIQETSQQRSTPFYRSPYSAFPSGLADVSQLKATKNKITTETWYLIEEESAPSTWVKESDLFFLQSDKSHFTFPNLSKKALHQQRNYNQKGFIKETTATLQLKDGWRAGDETKEGSRILINSIRSDWSCGKDENQKPICVASDKVLLPIDTVSRVKTLSGRWHDIKSRKKHLFQTTQNTFIPIAKTSEWVLDGQIAFRRPFNADTSVKFVNHDFNLNYTKVRIKQKEIRKWNQSHVKQHGYIWWQEPSSNKETPIIISTDELKNRTVFSKISTNPSRTSQNPSRPKSLSIASANGIFISQDESSWKFLSRFGEKNYPVAIGPKNTLIVGDQISFDEGLTFQNYLRWEQITLQTQKTLNHAPKHLKLSAINLIKQNILKIDIDTGYKILVFEFNTTNNLLSLHDSRLVNCCQEIISGTSN